MGVVGWALGGWLLRHDFGEVLIPFAFQEERIEAIQTVEIQHRRYLLEVPVRWAYEVSAADLLIPARWAVAAAWVLMVIGWGALLTATTRMQGFWPYLVYFAWVSWVFLSRAAEFWAGVNPLYIVSLGLSMGALLPAYLIQSGVWRLPLRFTGLFLTALVAFVLGLPTLWKGSVVLHDTLTYPGILSLAASLFVTLQAAIAWGGDRSVRSQPSSVGYSWLCALGRRHGRGSRAFGLSTNGCGGYLGPWAGANRGSFRV